MGKPENEQWINKRRTNFYNCFGKRMVDLILSSIGIVVFAIPMGIIAIIIKFSDPGPVLFLQKRVG